MGTSPAQTFRGISLIISGAQTGADQGGLRAAKALGIPTGGWAPKGFRTEEGPAPWLCQEFNLDEHDTEYDYEPRTRLNVSIADATVIFGRRSRGSNLTERVCQQTGKPYLWVADPLKPSETLRFRLWVARVRPETLNVAGNRESRNPGIGAHVDVFLQRSLR